MPELMGGKEGTGMWEEGRQSSRSTLSVPVSPWAAVAALEKRWQMG